jgi:hypothetical protein
MILVAIDLKQFPACGVSGAGDELRENKEKQYACGESGAI